MTVPDPRVRLANERTFLAWIRTSLGFIAAGIAIVYVARADEIAARALSLVLTSAGALLGIGGHWRWKKNNERISRALTLEPGRLPTLTTAFVVVAAVVAAILAISAAFGA